MTPYNYVFNNPLRFIDPFGLDSIAPNSPGGANNPIPLPGATIVHIQGQNENSGSNSSGWSLLLSGSNGSNNPNGSKLRRGDLWLEIGDILEALGNLIPGRLSKKPAKEKMAGKTIKKSSTEVTSDEDIIKENTGNPEVSGPENKTIVETYSEKTSKNDDSIYVKITIQKYMFPWSKTSIQGYPDSIKAHRKDSAKTVDYYENTIFE